MRHRSVCSYNICMVVHRWPHWVPIVVLCKFRQVWERWFIDSAWETTLGKGLRLQDFRWMKIMTCNGVLYYFSVQSTGLGSLSVKVWNLKSHCGTQKASEFGALQIRHPRTFCVHCWSPATLQVSSHLVSIWSNPHFIDEEMATYWVCDVAQLSLHHISTNFGSTF